MPLGSYIRFVMGIILSMEVLRTWVTGETLSMAAIVLAAALLALSALWFVIRF